MHLLACPVRLASERKVGERLVEVVVSLTVCLQLHRLPSSRSCNYLYIITMLQVIMAISLADLSSPRWATSGGHNGKGGFYSAANTVSAPFPDNVQKGFPPQLRSRIKTGYPDVCRGHLPAPQRRPMKCPDQRGTHSSASFLSTFSFL